jgi:hypothetical protein
VSCFRRGGPYEHPKGRACDFAAQPDGFGGVATGGDRAYGNNLAAYFVRNANRLGVLYVIWFEQIWTPSTGWRAYRNGRGDPSSDHTNHAHLSMYQRRRRLRRLATSEDAGADRLETRLHDERGKRKVAGHDHEHRTRVPC